MQRPKLFNRATVKLTLVYTAILMLLSLFFSGVIGYTTSRVVTKPSWHGDIVVSQSFRDGEVRRYLVEQERELNGRIVAALILVNLVVLVFGAGFSLLLARWTLRPIERAMDDETRFVADASHELRTPLAVIITENEVTLRDKKVSHKELEHQVESNLAEARKLQNLANYLLEINNSDAAVQMTEGDLTEIIKSAMSQVKKQAATRNIEFTRDVTPVKLMTAPDILSKIIAILLDNAVKYSPAKSRVTVVAGASQISIIDQGSGIPEEDLPHIFERFYRAEKSRTSEGFGLGLSLAEKLADKIGVKIEASNHHGADGTVAGAKFTIKL